MRVLGVLAVWGVLAVLATLCFAVGGSIGYRRGVQDAIRQFRERRGGPTGCRVVPLPHHSRRPMLRRRPANVVRPVHGGPRRPAVVVAGAHPAVRLRLPTAALAAVVAVAVLAVPGVAVGASTAQPGENLWHVKRAMERVRLAAAYGPESEFRVHVALASRRMEELTQLMAVDGGDPDVIGVVVADMHSHTEAATTRLRQLDAPVRRELAQRFDDVLQRQVAFLDTLLNEGCDPATAPSECVALDGTQPAAAALADDAAATGEPADAGTAPVSEPPAVSAATADVPTSDTAATSAETPATGGGEPASGDGGEAASKDDDTAKDAPSDGKDVPAKTTTAAAAATPADGGGQQGADEPADQPSSSTPSPAGAGTGTTAPAAGEGAQTAAESASDASTP